MPNTPEDLVLDMPLRVTCPTCRLARQATGWTRGRTGHEMRRGGSMADYTACQ